jgi:hypothetical protein
MKKVIIFFCILVVLPSFLAFAQIEMEGTGTIIGTFGLGVGVGTIVETASQFSFLFDLNLINKTGFTICLTNIVNVRSGALGPSQNLMFGAGYYYMRNKWNIGGAIIAAPTSQDLLLGGKINGGYYFSNNIGVTGTLIYRQTIGIVSDLSMFDAFAGISLRFF